MTGQRIAIIGAVAAGGSAAFKIKRIQPQATVQVFEADEFISYAACGLPYYVSGVIEDYRHMIMRDPADFAQAGIELFTSHQVESIDLSRGAIHVSNQKEQARKTFPFDTLLLATGARSFIPRVEGVHLHGVAGLRTLGDGLELYSMAHQSNIKRVVIIGGGYIGLELAESFKVLGKDVTLVEQQERVMPGIDDDMSALLEEEVSRKGVALRTGESLVAFAGDRQNQVRRVITDQGEYDVDLAVMALGVVPNSELAAEAGIRLGSRGAVVVDRYQRSSVPEVFAAGDCAETFHRVLQKNVYIPLGTNANRQGRLAAENICGVRKEYRGSLGSAVAKVFDRSLARTGLSEKEARDHEIPAAATKIEARDNAPYYPGGSSLHIKLVYNIFSGEILGAQIVGSEKAVKRIDVLAAAISSRMTLEELSDVDLAYAPPFSEVWDALSVAAAASEGERLRKKDLTGKEPS